MRSHAVWPCLVLASWAPAQEARAITLTVGGARLGIAVRQLAEASLAKLQVAPSIADNEIVVIRVKDAPLKGIMDRLANAVSGRWEQNGDTWTLGPDTRARSTQIAELKEKKLALLRAQIKGELSPPKQKKEGEEDIQAIGGGGDLIVTKIVSTLDLPSLVDLPEEGRVVYSTIPNRLQRNLRLAPNVIQELVSANNKEAAEQPPEEATDPESQKMRDYMERFGLARKRKQIKEEPYKAVLIVERTGMMMGSDSLQATIRLYSNEGSVLLSRTNTYYVGGNPLEPPAEESPEEGKKDPPKSEPQSPKLEWSPVTKELLTKMSQGPFAGGGAPSKPWSEAAREALANPDRIEPLQYLVGDGLVQVAAWKETNLVASIPDDIAESVSGGSAAPTCVALLNWIEASNSLDSKFDAGWWIVVPKDPLGTREGRFDRLAMTVVAHKAIADGHMSVDDLASYALKSKPPMSTPLGAIMLFTLDPSIVRLAFMPDAWDYLRLWGTLSPQQKLGPPEGIRISFSTLTPAQQAIANTVVFGAMPQLQVGERPADMDVLGTFGSMMTMGFGSGEQQDNDFREEPTELLPNGLPGAGFIFVQVKSDIALKPAGAGGEADWLTMFGTIGVEDLALYKFMEEKMGAAGTEGVQKIDRVTLGKRSNIALELHLAEGVVAKQKFADDVFDKDAKPMSVENLSPEMKARIDKAVEQIKKLNLPFFDPAMFGRPPGPPPAR